MLEAGQRRLEAVALSSVIHQWGNLKQRGGHLLAGDFRSCLLVSELSRLLILVVMLRGGVTRLVAAPPK